MFTVPMKGLEQDGTLHIVLEFGQEKFSRKDTKLAYLRADLFKVNL